MTVTPRARNVALTAHVACSVGWLGAIAGFLALAVVGLAGRDPGTVRAAYLLMEPTAWFVLVPFALASLVTGLVQSLATSWGLFRHYWVLAKLVINLLATTILLLYLQTLGALGERASRTPPAGDGLGELRSASPLLHAAAALLLLLLATALAVFKPRGLTPYGVRKQRQRRGTTAAA